MIKDDLHHLLRVYNVYLQSDKEFYGNHCIAATIPGGRCSPADTMAPGDSFFSGEYSSGITMANAGWASWMT